MEAASTPAERAECQKAREWCFAYNKYGGGTPIYDNSGKKIGIHEGLYKQECINTYHLREAGRDPNNFSAVSYYKEPWRTIDGVTPSPCTAYGPNGYGDCSALHFYNNREFIKRK